MNAQVVGISTDSTYVHKAWAATLGGVSYPLLSDFYPHGAVAQAYGVFHAGGMSERALFVVDTTGIVRYIDVHSIGEVPDVAVLFEELAKLG